MCSNDATVAPKLWYFGLTSDLLEEQGWFCFQNQKSEDTVASKFDDDFSLLCSSVLDAT